MLSVEFEEQIKKLRNLMNGKYFKLEEYYRIVLDSLNWKGNVSDLLDEKGAKEFINHTFESERDNSKIKACLDSITPFRAVHTLSSFLLGVVVKNQLSIDMRKWRRLPNEKTLRGSFILFWKWICLFHDIGYCYENNSNEYTDCKSISKLIERLKIDNSLLDNSDNASIIENYYSMRIEKNEVDHGIVGALLLYDALIDLSDNSEQYSKIKNHREFYVKICDAIALHNMWRVTNLDDKQKVKEYMDKGLQSLIKNSDETHKIFLNDNQLLFLLSLVDTIDPIKALSNSDESPTTKGLVEIMEQVEVEFIYNRKGIKKRITLKCDNPRFKGFAKKQIDEKSGLQTWLGVDVDYMGDNLIIDINTERSIR